MIAPRGILVVVALLLATGKVASAVGRASRERYVEKSAEEAVALNAPSSREKREMESLAEARVGDVAGRREWAAGGNYVFVPGIEQQPSSGPTQEEAVFCAAAVVVVALIVGMVRKRASSKAFVKKKKKKKKKKQKTTVIAEAACSRPTCLEEKRQGKEVVAERERLASEVSKLQTEASVTAEAEATTRRRLIRSIALAEAARVKAFAGEVGVGVEANLLRKRLARELVERTTKEKGAAAEIASKDKAIAARRREIASLRKELDGARAGMEEMVHKLEETRSHASKSEEERVAHRNEVKEAADAIAAVKKEATREKQRLQEILARTREETVLEKTRLTEEVETLKRQMGPRNQPSDHAKVVHPPADLVRAGQILATPSRGIMNQTKRCFLNSAVQFLFTMPRLRELVSALAGSATGGRRQGASNNGGRQDQDTSKKAAEPKSDEDVEMEAVVELGLAFKDLEREGVSSPANIYKFENKMHELVDDTQDWKKGQQDDAGEALRLIMGAIEGVAKRAKGEMGDVASDVNFLEWASVGHHKCSNCGKEPKSRKDITTTIQVTLNSGSSPGGATTRLHVERLLEQEFGSKSVVEDFECGVCGTRGNADGWATLRRVPDHAMLQLRRHNYDKKARIGSKVSTFVQFDVDKLLVFPGNPGKLYLLVAVLRHHGATLNSGHYTTVVRMRAEPGSDWTCLDDTRVTAMRSADVCDGNAYQLLYRQLDDRDESRYLAAGNRTPTATTVAPRASARGRGNRAAPRGSVWGIS